MEQNLGVHKTIAKSYDFQKKKNLCCLRQNQKLQKKLSKIAKVIGTNLQGSFENISKMLLIFLIGRKLQISSPGSLRKKKSCSRTPKLKFFNNFQKVRPARDGTPRRRGVPSRAGRNFFRVCPMRFNGSFVSFCVTGRDFVKFDFLNQNWIEVHFKGFSFFLKLN